MEAVLEREAAAPKIDWRNVHMYDEDGKRITNARTLRAMAEGQEIIAEWERRIDRYLREEARRGKEEDKEVDGTEE